MAETCPQSWNDAKNAVFFKKVGLKPLQSTIALTRNVPRASRERFQVKCFSGIVICTKNWTTICRFPLL